MNGADKEPRQDDFDGADDDDREIPSGVESSSKSLRVIWVESTSSIKGRIAFRDAVWFPWWYITKFPLELSSVSNSWLDGEVNFADI